MRVPSVPSGEDVTSLIVALKKYQDRERGGGGSGGGGGGGQIETGLLGRSF